MSTENAQFWVALNQKDIKKSFEDVYLNVKKILNSICLTIGFHDRDQVTWKYWPTFIMKTILLPKSTNSKRKKPQILGSMILKVVMKSNNFINYNLQDAFTNRPYILINTLLSKYR